MKLNFKQETETATLPSKHTLESAGIDFYSDSERVVIWPRETKIIDLGISWCPEVEEIILEDYTVCLILQSRSGLAFKNDIEASNAGVIDLDYIPHGNEKALMKAKLYNYGEEKFVVRRGDKICQGVLHLVPKCEDDESIRILSESRLGKGFGSSDLKE